MDLTPVLQWGVLWGALVLLLDLVLIVRAITREQGVERTLMWIFAIVAFPVIGAVFYLMLASPSIRRARRKKRAASARARRAAGLPDDGLRIAPEDLAPPGSLPALANTMTHLPPSTGNVVELLVGDTGAFLRMRGAIEGATRSIWAEYYIVSNDETGRFFLDLLVAKAKEGVQVRFLFDAVGSLGLDEQRLQRLREAGGRAEIFLPFNPLRRRWSVQLRNHRKLIVVDGEVGFTGGMNIGDEYSGLARKRGAAHFRDSHLQLAGPCVRDLAQVFAEDWTFATGEALEELPDVPPLPDGHSVVCVVPSGPDQQPSAIGMVYFAGIAGAQSRVWLTTPYFIPDEAITRALESAALRGVDVRLLLPAKSDLLLVSLASRGYFPRLVRAGVKVYEYLPTMHHAKTMLVDDDLSLVGSANVDIRSFRLNFELSALVVDAALATRLAQRFEHDLQDSRLIDLRRIAERSLPVRVRDGVARLLSPVL